MTSERSSVRPDAAKTVSAGPAVKQISRNARTNATGRFFPFMDRQIPFLSIIDRYLSV